jgi:hypothetical protein
MAASRGVMACAVEASTAVAARRESRTRILAGSNCVDVGVDERYSASQSPGRSPCERRSKKRESKEGYPVTSEPPVARHGRKEGEPKKIVLNHGELKKTNVGMASSQIPSLGPIAEREKKKPWTEEKGGKPSI